MLKSWREQNLVVRLLLCGSEILLVGPLSELLEPGSDDEDSAVRDIDRPFVLVIVKAKKIEKDNQFYQLSFVGG